VKVIDGKSDKLTEPTSVLVVRNKIEKIGADVATISNCRCRKTTPGQFAKQETTF
jgi:hypothetical protein